MTADGFLDTLCDDNETALSRLGSSKSLYALTGGEMDADAVLAAAADDANAAAETYGAWADDGDVALFAEAAAAERDHYDDVTAEIGDHDATATPAVYVYLDGLDDPVARLGGLVGASLAGKQRATQTSGFFTGEADPSTASLFREYGSTLEARRDAAVDALADLADDDGDWDRAADAASGAVQAAYDDYVEKLEAMGVNPKPVC
ncbi:rubrerythrin family protein [Halostella litorea]|uniref:rubrerythrin family protein n=1 Tax=Halostella litorea TaxID=2528831 RepID=UPI001091FFF8|nr:rubrerythrin family protein [Halostella litorea]